VVRLIAKLAVPPNSQVEAYRLYDESSQKVVPNWWYKQEILKQIGYQYGGISNATVEKDPVNKSSSLKLVGTEASLDRLPLLDHTGKLVSKNALSIVGYYIHNFNQEKVFKVVDYKGDVTEMWEKALIDAVTAPKSAVTLANGKVSTKGTKSFISAIKREFVKLR